MSNTPSGCRVFGTEYASNDAHRQVLNLLISGFPSSETTILCEPSLHRSSKSPPDVVVVDPIAGVHVIEVKGYTLPQVEAIAPGGLLRVRYYNGVQDTHPIAQVRNAMFDIKNTTERFIENDIRLSFKYWVAFPNITRAEWIARWGNDAFCPSEFRFADDMDDFVNTIRNVGSIRLGHASLTTWPESEIAAVWKAFGDSSVIYPPTGKRPVRHVAKHTLGKQFDDAAEAYKQLSEEQQRLSQQNWHEGPRLVRGVAGSGKTIVLANNLARRLQRHHTQTPLFRDGDVRILAVCNNRSLVPFLKTKIELAYQQRAGEPLPENTVDVFYKNGLMWHLAQRGLWRYQQVDNGTDETRAQCYLSQLEGIRRDHPEIAESAFYDAIYVDEGQDFVEDDFRLLTALCRVRDGSEPNLYIFYDDAQNFLGRPRPNWRSLGLNVVGGRAMVMSKCFRNTRPVVEAAFNVLYGTSGGTNAQVPTQQFSDVSWLKDKHLIVERDGFWHVHFAARDGHCAPTLTVTPSKESETKQVVDRLRWLIETERVRPQDILLLCYSNDRLREVKSHITRTITQSPISGVTHLHDTSCQKDDILCKPDTVTLSTTASAKGYDAYCVLLVSGNDFPSDVEGRINFYIGCTRAIEYLEVFAYRKERLVIELESVLAKQKALTPNDAETSRSNQ